MNQSEISSSMLSVCKPKFDKLSLYAHYDHDIEKDCQERYAKPYIWADTAGLRVVQVRRNFVELQLGKLMPAINRRMLAAAMITSSSESILDFVILCMSENSDLK